VSIVLLVTSKGLSGGNNYWGLVVEGVARTGGTGEPDGIRTLSRSCLRHPRLLCSYGSIPEG
jgi:hypothetical protein